MTATANGKPRRQLADQLDRLDAIIDALAEALPEAVADACRDGAREAVRAAAAEILADPDLRALLAGPAARVAPAAPAPVTPPADPAPAKPRFWARAKARFVAARDAAVGRYTAAVTTVAATARALAAVLPVRKVLLAGAGVGLAAGAAAYLCPPAVAAAIGGAGWAVTAAGVQAARWARRSAAAFGLGAS